MVVKSKISVPYTWWAGDTASKFLVSLRDEQKIKGTRCGSCNKVYIPPRKTCPTCFTENSEWVDVSDEGTLVSYTVTRKQLASIPRKVPVIYGLIKLDGADTSILHFIDDVPSEELKIGMRLKAEFSKDRTGTIRDISHFKPV